MSDKNKKKNKDNDEPKEGQPAESVDATDETVEASIDDEQPDEQPDEPAADDDSEARDGETGDDELSAEDQRLLDDASRDLVSDMRDQMLRAQAELVNFRTRVERDRVANREAVIADVIRSMLPALDDLDRADKHGDIIDGSPLALVAQKINSSCERFGLRRIGEKGELFDPAFHEAVVHLSDPEATENTIADVIEPGYILGERVVRAAKVAVSGPTE